MNKMSTASYQRLSDEERKCPTLNGNYLLLTVLCVMAFVAGASYNGWAMYVTDGYDRNLIHIEQREYAIVRNNSLTAKRTVDLYNQQEQMVDMMRMQVDELMYNDTALIADPTIALWHSINNTIAAANQTCVTRTTQLLAIVGQIINGTNATAQNIFTGTCNLVGGVNDTLTLDYTYNLIDIGGIDFYFYEFSGTNGTVETGTTPARIEGCVPSIFIGNTGNGAVFRSQIDGLVGSPASPVDYVSTITVGDERLVFEPVAGADPMQTIGIEEMISVWVSFF